MKTTRISQILNRLLSEKRLRVTELARQIDLPQPTVHRIANGTCEHPHISSLQPIADYFSITVDQLKGLDFIPWLDKIQKIPLLSWKECINWPKNKNKLKENQWILSDKSISNKAYALKVEDASMAPLFPAGTLLIADPEKKAEDRQYVIVKLAKFEAPLFRELIQNGASLYLKPLSPDLSKDKLMILSKNDSILATVLEARRYLDE